MSEDELRNEILEKVKQYYRQKKESQFVPGQSMVCLLYTSDAADE